jgi:hypothetical protein
MTFGAASLGMMETEFPPLTTPPLTTPPLTKSPPCGNAKNMPDLQKIPGAAGQFLF